MTSQANEVTMPDTNELYYRFTAKIDDEESSLIIDRGKYVGTSTDYVDAEFEHFGGCRTAVCIARSKQEAKDKFVKLFKQDIQDQIDFCTNRLQIIKSA